MHQALTGQTLIQFLVYLVRLDHFVGAYVIQEQLGPSKVKWATMACVYTCVIWTFDLNPLSSVRILVNVNKNPGLSRVSHLVCWKVTILVLHPLRSIPPLAQPWLDPVHSATGGPKIQLPPQCRAGE